MNIIMKQTAALKPYKNNPRINQEAVEYVAESIREFGFKNPIVIDGKGEIINGHTRNKAAQLLGLTEVPCIVADDLTTEQVKAFRLVDNKSSEQAIWDSNKLNDELFDLSAVFDMGKFDFKLPELDLKFTDTPRIDPEDVFSEEMGNEQEETPEGLNWASETQDRVANILNLGIAQFPGVGDFDIPEILPEYDLPDVDEWIPFDMALTEKSPENKGVHFFRDDYKFERIWNLPKKYIELLSRFRVVLAPDFSPYGDMPLITQIFNHYRKHWCARYWQENGIMVIPTIRASTDPRSQSFYLDGEPKGAVVALSAMWSTQFEEESKSGFQQMVERLEPCHLLIYGKAMEFIEESGIPFTRVPSFAEARWGGINDAEA